MDNSNKLAKISDISGVKKRRIVDSFGLNEPPLKAPKQSSSDETKEKEKDYNVNQNKGINIFKIDE